MSVEEQIRNTEEKVEVISDPRQIEEIMRQDQEAEDEEALWNTQQK